MEQRTNGHTTPVGISIGAMSKACGIPANTLRTWERRYDFPQPQRTASGQRLYDPALIGHLRLVAQALEAGHRPRQVLELSVEELSTLLGTVQSRPVTGSNELMTTWLEAVQTLDERTLDAGFRSEAARLGLLRFLTERVGPLMVTLGTGWRAGCVEVYQEHWASERLRSFLADQWQGLATDAVGPTVVAAALSGDRHDLGLHMAVSVMAMCGWRIVFLGRDTPNTDIAAATQATRAAAVVISVSPAMDDEDAQRALEELHTVLPADVPLIVGGSGAPDAHAGIHRLGSLEELFEWAAGA